MKNLLFICLLLTVIPGHATLTWTQQDMTLNSTDINQDRDLFILPVAKASFPFTQMLTVCSANKSSLPVAADDLIIAPVKIKTGETTVSLIPGGSNTITPAKFTVTAPVNPATITVYCSPLVRNDSTGQLINGSDASIQGVGVELTIHYSSVPQVFLAPASPRLDLGVCRTGGKLEKPLPVNIYFVGDNVPGGLNTTLSWAFTRDAGNPASDEPQVKHAGSVQTTASISTAFTQTPTDADLALLFLCDTPGSYLWTMNLTATPQ